MTPELKAYLDKTRYHDEKTAQRGRMNTTPSGMLEQRMRKSITLAPMSQKHDDTKQEEQRKMYDAKVEEGRQILLRRLNENLVQPDSNENNGYEYP